MPLADRIRPQTLTEFVGQEHLTSPGKPIHALITKKQPLSHLYWGPPGVGKTTLAKIIANATGSNFVTLSAVTASKDDVRQVIKSAQEKQFDLLEAIEQVEKKLSSVHTTLFLDEIHRFNKAQQDFLLPYVENGTITLIGATTENPSFEVIPALLSRMHVYVLESLTQDHILEILRRGAASLGIRSNTKAFEYIIQVAGGDARKALNLLEATHTMHQKITKDTVASTLQSSHLRYDKQGDEHYNTISAFIKSMRASDADAAIYYLSRMIESGEDPLFIARRMVIFASEDIGLAQPTAIVVANAVFRACETIGYPECAINLSHGTAYLARAQKNRSAYDALRNAQADIKTYGHLPIPKKILNAPTQLMKDQGYAKDYDPYTSESLLPDKIKGKIYLE